MAENSGEEKELESLQNEAISTQVVANAIQEAGSREDYMNAKEEAPIGVLAKYGNDDVNESSTLDVKKKMAEFKKKSQDFQKNMDEVLGNVTPEKLGKAIFGPGGVPQPISQVWGVFEKVLCWDGDIPFSIQDLLDALDLKFNFSLAFEICKRQGNTDPITGLLNSLNRLEREANDLINVGPRLLNNLKDGVSNFVKNLGLPPTLQRCMLDNAVMSTSYKFNDVVSLNDLGNLIRSTDAKICRKSNKGIGNTRNTFVQKAAVSPFVEGLTAYNRETAFSSIVSIANNPKIDSSVVNAVLSESFKDKPNNNTVQFMEILVLLNAYKKDKETSKSTSIGNVNTLLLNSSNSLLLPDGSYGDASDLLLSTALDKNKGKDLNKVLGDVVENGVYIPPIKADVLLENMKDDYSETNKPKEDLDKIKNLLDATISGYDPKENISSIAKSDPIMTLVGMETSSTRGDKLIKNGMDKQLEIYKTKTNDDPYFQAYLINATRKACEPVETAS